jgi:hypothetical protein
MYDHALGNILMHPTHTLDQCLLWLYVQPKCFYASHFSHDGTPVLVRFIIRFLLALLLTPPVSLQLPSPHLSQ